jgi:hypothetical protein
MDRATPLPRITSSSAPDIAPPELPRIPLRNVAQKPKPQPLPHSLMPAMTPAPATKPTYGFTKPIQATKLYRATPCEYRG